MRDQQRKNAFRLPTIAGFAAKAEQAGPLEAVMMGAVILLGVVVTNALV